ncbi:MAG: ATP-binding protein, partial [Nanoarchaeota archaeon]|nr:ATP-binding protein [Nanoarchaeota archaeon]
MLARLFGRSNIYNFRIEIFGDIKTFDFLKVTHQDNGEVLCQVINITRDSEKLIGDCKVIGFKDSGVLKNIRTPFINEAQIQIADDLFIEKTVGLNIDTESFIGLLEHHPNLRISLDLKKTITKHIAVLAKSGAGKSYTVGVFLEEVMKKNIPIVILDPHNEYSSIKYPNTDKKDLQRLSKFGLSPQGFLERVKEYSPDTNVNPQSEPISLDISTLKPQDLIDSLPQKISPAQQSLIFNVLSNLNNRVNFDELIFNISNEESNAKWSLISLIEQLKKLKVYSSNPTPLQEIVKYKQTSIISLKGVEPYVQETFVSGLLKELFEARKKEEIPPFLLVLEEAHNFCPERGFGELKTSKVIRTIAGEGRKFGIGLCVISQRPAKVDKNVVSQCTTQILLKMTNPNDIKSVIASSEGVDSSSENEIQKLNIGTCLLTGVIDIPLKVNIRPRISKHGGETVDITLPYEAEGGANSSNPSSNNSNNYQSNNGNFSQENNNYSNHSYQSNKNASSNSNSSQSSFLKGENSEFIQFIAPEIEANDAKTMLNTDKIEIQLVPASMIKMKTASGKESNILFDRVNSKIIKTIFPFEGYDVGSGITTLTESEKKLLKIILTLENKFNPAELLLKTDVMFNEILRVCDSLAKKGFLKKVDRSFEISGIMFAK